MTALAICLIVFFGIFTAFSLYGFLTCVGDGDDLGAFIGLLLLCIGIGFILPISIIML